MSKLRIGFVGTGYMGQLAHLANYVHLPEVELVAVAEGRQKLARRVADHYGVAAVYPDHRALLSDAKVDAVVAIMGYGLHHAVVPDLLRAGKHVITEKPICNRASTAAQMAKLAADQGVVYQVGYMKRCDLGSRYVKALADQYRQSGELGSLRYLRATMPPGPWQLEIEPPLGSDEPGASYEGETWEPFPEWMDRPTADLYNAFINYYIHQVNLLRYLLGEDYQVRYADPAGVTFTATSDSGVPVILEMAPYTSPDHWEETYTVFFEHGFLELTLPAPLARQHPGRVRVFRGKERPTTFEQPVLAPRWAFGEQAKLFVAACRGEIENISPAADAAKDLATAEEYVRRLLESR